jgi:NhaA family Na+:H+ antiporter
MSQAIRGSWLDRPVDDSYDHVLGPANARITLVEYGSYACPYCRAANESIAALRDQFGERMRYVFRQRRSRTTTCPPRRRTGRAGRSSISGRRTSR